MPTIEDALNNNAAPAVEELPEIDTGEEVSQGFNPGGLIEKLLTTETGPGDYRSSEYMEHPLNFNGQEGTAQIIRGITGFTDNIRLAILDIIFGAFKLITQRRRAANETAAQGFSNQAAQ